MLAKLVAGLEQRLSQRMEGWETADAAAAGAAGRTQVRVHRRNCCMSARVMCVCILAGSVWMVAASAVCMVWPRVRAFSVGGGCTG